MKTVNNLRDIKNKKILMRVDFNVPTEKGKITETLRIDKTISEIKKLASRGAKILLISHLGDDGKESMEVVHKYLSKKIKNVFVSVGGEALKKSSAFFERLETQISSAGSGTVFLLDNIRKFPGEMKNDQTFAKMLARTCDFYINNAFSVSHRKHASIVSLPKYLPHFLGELLQSEIENISKIIKNPKRPILSIIGGAKFQTKLPILKKMLKISDLVFVGGALANELLLVSGVEIGKSLIENYKGAKTFVKNKKIILPIDVVVGDDKNKTLNEIGESDVISDIGRETVSVISEIIFKAKTIFWNGPIGIYEKGFDGGTKKLLSAILGSRAYALLGGGDTLAVFAKMKKKPSNIAVSLGGGAMLEYLTNGKLPGIEALK